MPNSSTYSILRRLQLVFFASILILLASSYASYFSIRKLIENSQLVNHTNAILKESETLISYIKDAETGQRGYLLSRNPAYLEPYNGAYEKTIQSLNDLKRYAAEQPEQQEVLSRLKVLIDQRFERLRILMDKNNFDITELTTGRKLMDEIRELINNFQTRENSLLEQRTKEQTAYISYTPILLVIASMISILITTLAYVRIKKDMDQRILEQSRKEAEYLETSKRISVLENVTRHIADGNFKTRSADTIDDEIGKIGVALNSMAEALEKNFNDLEERNWQQEGSVQLGEAMRGQNDKDLLSERLLKMVTERLHAFIGCLYIWDDGDFSLAASYAVSNPPEIIRIGEGLTGQVAKTGEYKLVEDIPSDYFNIISAVGKTKPAQVLIFPIKHYQNIIGVLELGFLNQLGSREIDFLENNSEAIGIAINSALNYKRLQELLEETQSQAEELQAQHSELENLNTELEAQAQKLQASEEELRVQQEELQQTNQELEERTRMLEEKNELITERNLEVQRKAEELALSTKYKSEFLANMSHELRTPLNSILLLSRLLAENSDHTLSPDQVEYAQVIQSSGNGLLALIDEILDLSKIEAGKMDLEYSQVSVDGILKDLKGLFQPIARDKNIEFKVETSSQIPEIIETDKLRLEQILKNLLSNAIKFTGKGYVLLSAEKSSDNTICFSVKDTGIGIPKEKQRHIFEAFQQADGSTRRKFGGTGLGLSISRELVKLLGGHLKLESEPEKGSEFKIFIPVSKQAKILEEPAVKPSVLDENTVSIVDRQEVEETESAKDLKEFTVDVIPESIPDDRKSITSQDRSILIVEDDIGFAKALLDFTRKKGYKGIVSVRGDEGVELAQKYLPVGILLDIQLPVKNGWEVMEELKNNPATRHIPVHIMSSHSVKRESLVKGAIDFIDKPVSFTQLQDVFKKLEFVLNKKSKKVLIVEENPKHAKALAYFLETFNVNSEIRNSVSEGISALNRDGVDCVILDMGIPNQASYNTLEDIKKNPGLENLPIIIFTGKSLSRSEEQKIKQYADSIVVKTAHSYKRILDEVSLFLHLVEEQKGKESELKNKKLGALNEVLQHKTVLIVDDDVRNVFSLTKALEGFKMNVLAATDGKEALEQLAANPGINVVLMDMMMPEMDGYETTQRIRSKPAFKNLPVIAVTAKAMTGDREKCIRAGASDYITKPVDIDQLISLLRVWLYDSVTV